MTCSEVSLRQTFVHVTLDYKKRLWSFSFLLNNPLSLLWSLREEWSEPSRSSAGIPAVVILGTRIHGLQSRAWHGSSAAHSWAHRSTRGSENMLVQAWEWFGLSRVTHENSKLMFPTLPLGLNIVSCSVSAKFTQSTQHSGPSDNLYKNGTQSPPAMQPWFHTLLLHSEMLTQFITSMCCILSITTGGAIVADSLGFLLQVNASHGRRVS